MDQTSRNLATEQATMHVRQLHDISGTLRKLSTRRVWLEICMSYSNHGHFSL